MVRNAFAPRPLALTKLKPNVTAGSSAHGNVEGVTSSDMADRWDDDAADAVGKLLEARGVHDVKAFALLTLHNGSDIAVRTSKNVRQFAQSIAPKALRQHLRQIYEDASSDSAGRTTEHSTQVSTTRPDAATGLPVRTVQPQNRQDPADEFPTEQDPADARQLPVSRLRAQTATSDSGHDFSEVEEPDCTTTAIIPLRLGDTFNVKLQLEHRLRSLHQLPVKRIAKLWIKAICPKKQAKFPYQNKSYEKSTGLSPPVPKWWPDTSVCVYTEPDHIHRDHRVPLCIHLLRLRPSPEQLMLWNKDKPNAKPHPTHANVGWTAFLREHALTQITDEDLRGGSPEQCTRRRKLLEEMYEIAEREEFALSGDSGYGINDIINIEDASVKIKKKTQMNRKRARASWMVQAATPQGSRSSSLVREPRQKKLRIAASRGAVAGAHHLTNSDATDGIEGHTSSQPIRRPGAIAGPTLKYESPAMIHTFPYQTHGYDNNQLSHDVFQPQYAGWPRGNHGVSDPPPVWTDTISPNSSFNSTGSLDNCFGPLSSIPGQYQHDALMHSAQQQVQVNYAGHLPQPEWDTVPNTPAGPHATLMGLAPNPMAELDRLADNGITPMSLGTQVIHGQGYLDPTVLNTDGVKYEPLGHDQVQRTDQQGYSDLLALEQSQGYPVPGEIVSQATPHGLPFQYPDFQAPSEFQAPARVLRPFTGHCSGVGGGAWT